MKIVHKALLGIFVLVVLFLNVRLYHKDDFSNGYNQDVYHQLSYLKVKMHDGAAQEMQTLFPEGFMFMHALYSLTWLELMEQIDPSNKIFKEAQEEVDWSLQAMNSSGGKAVFSDELLLPYGAFYRGWSNYVLGKKLALYNKIGVVDSFDIKAFEKNCEEIFNAYQSSNTVYLESYYAQTWPADNIIAMASLAGYDPLMGPKYEEFVNDWVLKVRQHLDPETGLIPHAVSAKTGATLIGARGSSQSLINSFLSEIDPSFAAEQFDIYQSQFFDHRLFLPGVREYPNGQEGAGDIDSGPVIWGIGGAASIVGVRAMGVNQNWGNHFKLKNCIEAFGMPISISGKKKSVFGQLPMADAFIAWSNVVNKNQYENQIAFGWSWKFQLLSGVIILLCGWVILKW